MPDNNATKKKIAILGGGIGSLSTAYELTDYEGWQDHYDITVYQMGWLLGGKCATKRGANNRIEEHGIHLFLGFYNNAFRMFQGVFKEQKNKGLNPENPFKTWEDAFERQDSIFLPEYSKLKEKWLRWSLVFPRNELVPGVGGSPNEWVNAKKMMTLALEILLGNPFEKANQKGCLGFLAPLFEKMFRLGAKNATDDIKRTVEKDSKKDSPELHYASQGETHPEWWTEVDEHVRKNYKHISGPIEYKYLHHAKTLAETMPESEEEAGQLVEQNGPHPHGVIVKLLYEFVVGVEKFLIDIFPGDDAIRRWWIMTQLAYVIYKGLNSIYDKKTGKYDFDSINHLDFRTWLVSLGAHESVVWSAPVKDIYTLIFAYPEGDTTQAGKVAAGTALLGAMLIVLLQGLSHVEILSWYC